MNKQIPSFVSSIDTYVYQSLQGIEQSTIVVQTTMGTVTGLLTTVMPDHIIVESGGSRFFIRIQQIVWVIPKNGGKRDV
ncbi:YuzF family protein [Amphibacillus sediminis]|uniref:YuzF family protein n=1 Tax=Amphibacillus sediminis TaxID=360185 RepID=UPI00082A3369|nr:YuzF family protein [Amphibacillus sediminis]